MVRISHALCLAVVSASESCQGETCPAEKVQSNSMLQRNQRLKVSDFVETDVQEDKIEAEDDDSDVNELDQMQRDADAERQRTWDRVMAERQRLVVEAKSLPDVALTETQTEGVDVSCGGHMERTCAECPGEVKNPWARCNGDCSWRGLSKGKCLNFDDPELRTEGRVLVLNEGGDMKRSNLDGSELRTLLSANTPCPSMAKSETQAMANSFASRPIGVAVDEAAGMVFWTDWFGGTRVQQIDPKTDNPYNRSHLRWLFNASILSAPLDGTVITPIVTTGEVIQPKGYPPIYWPGLRGEPKPEQKLTWPYFIALDRSTKTIYWTERLEHKIQRCNYTGGELDVDFHTTEQEPMGIAVDSASKRIYYSAFHRIFYVSVEGGKSTLLAYSVGQVKGMDYDPLQNYVYFASLGTTRNPGGILKVKGPRQHVSKPDRCGISWRGRAWNKKAWASCENVVYLPMGRDGIAAGPHARGAISTPFDVKGDFEAGVLLWTGDEPLGGRDGLGGRLYRTDLCKGVPTQGKDRRNKDKKPRGDFKVVNTFKGTAMSPGYVQGVALLKKHVDFKGAMPPALCKASATSFEVEATQTKCYGNSEWRSKTGASCMDHKLNNWCENGTVGSGWGASWGTFKQYAKEGEPSADEACCVCGNTKDERTASVSATRSETDAPGQVSATTSPSVSAATSASVSTTTSASVSAATSASASTAISASVSAATSASASVATSASVSTTTSASVSTTTSASVSTTMSAVTSATGSALTGETDAP